MTIAKQASIILGMSAETFKYCMNCTFGKIIGGGEIGINISSKGAIPLGFSVPPKIERNCLNLIDRYVRRMKPKVRFLAQCVKPEKYSPKANNTSDKSA